MTTSTWASGVNGNFDDMTKWTGNHVPVAGDTALITASGTYTVFSDATNTIANLDMAKTATLDVHNDLFSVTSGASAHTLAGTITVDDAAGFQLGTDSTATTFDNTGTIDIESGADPTKLRIAGTVTLTGKGKVDLSGGLASIVSDGAAGTLANSSTILGVGQVGGMLLSLDNAAKGIVDADTPGTLSVMAATTTNAGTMESTGGTLLLGTNVTQPGNGKIKATASGSGIQLDGIMIDGGSVSTAKGALIVPISGTSEINTAKAVVNDGDILTDGGNLIIDGNLKNAKNSVFQVELGTSIKVGGTVTGGDAVVETGGGTIEFGGPSSADVTFNANGTLILDDPAKFTGTVSGMTTNTGALIDFENLKFADSHSANYNSTTHVLTVADTTTGVIDKIKVASLADINFHDAGDGSLEISDPAPASVPLLVQAMASFGANGSTATSDAGNVTGGHPSPDFLAPPHHG